MIHYKLIGYEQKFYVTTFLKRQLVHVLFPSRVFFHLASLKMYVMAATPT